MSDKSSGGERRVAACPFCGESDVDVELSENSMDAWAYCTDCLAQGPVVTVGCRDDDDEPIDLEGEAFDAWDARNATAAQPARGGK